MENYIKGVKENFSLKKLFIGLAILLLLSLWLLGKFSCENKIPATVDVAIPATTGKFEAVKPKQEVIAKKGNHIVGINKKVLEKMTDKEREFFQFQIDSLLSLTTAYEQEFVYASSDKKDSLYKKSIQLKSFSQPFENDKIKITANGLVRGTIEKISFDYTIKEQKIKVDLLPEKEVKFRLLAGGGFGIDKALSQPIYNAGSGWQNKKGNVFILDVSKIGNTDYYSAKVYLSIFDIKK